MEPEAFRAIPRQIEIVMDGHSDVDAARAHPRGDTQLRAPTRVSSPRIGTRRMSRRQCDRHGWALAPIACKDAHHNEFTNNMRAVELSQRRCNQRA
jgi:hypothetical protein